MVRAAVSLCGIELDNPVIPASGTFGYGYTFAELYDIDCLGTFSFKGTTREQRLGNAQPRIAEAPGGMLNAVGLQNPGVDAVIAEELPRLKQVFQLCEEMTFSKYKDRHFSKEHWLLSRDKRRVSIYDGHEL